jgi:transcription elongation factor/antiterminator RfaH
MSESMAWYCIHTKAKSEHIAAALLRTLEGVEAYCPRIRYQKSTRRGKVWFVEALFPRYIFARFDVKSMMRAVKHTLHVVRVVEFGHQGPTSIPDEVIEQLQVEMNYEDVVEVSRSIEVGDEVELTDGPMRGLKGVVQAMLSGQDRVRVLLEFLGRQSAVELDIDKLLADRSVRGELAYSRYGND